MKIRPQCAETIKTAYLFKSFSCPSGICIGAVPCARTDAATFCSNGRTSSIRRSVGESPGKPSQYERAWSSEKEELTSTVSIMYNATLAMLSSGGGVGFPDVCERARCTARTLPFLGSSFVMLTSSF